MGMAWVARHPVVVGLRYYLGRGGAIAINSSLLKNNELEELGYSLLKKII